MGLTFAQLLQFLSVDAAPTTDPVTNAQWVADTPTWVTPGTAPQPAQSNGGYYGGYSYTPPVAGTVGAAPTGHDFSYPYLNWPNHNPKYQSYITFNYGGDVKDANSGAMGTWLTNVRNTLQLKPGGTLHEGNKAFSPKSFDDTADKIKTLGDQLTTWEKRIEGWLPEVGDDNSELQGSTAGTFRNLLHSLANQLWAVRETWGIHPDSNSLAAALHTAATDMETAVKRVNESFEKWATSPQALPSTAMTTTMETEVQPAEHGAGDWDAWLEWKEGTGMPSDISMKTNLNGTWMGANSKHNDRDFATAFEGAAKKVWQDGLAASLDPIAADFATDLDRIYDNVSKALRLNRESSFGPKPSTGGAGSNNTNTGGGPNVNQPDWNSILNGLTGNGAPSVNGPDPAQLTPALQDSLPGGTPETARMADSPAGGAPNLNLTGGPDGTGGPGGTGNPSLADSPAGGAPNLNLTGGPDGTGGPGGTGSPDVNGGPGGTGIPDLNTLQNKALGDSPAGGAPDLNMSSLGNPALGGGVGGTGDPGFGGTGDPGLADGVAAAGLTPSLLGGPTGGLGGLGGGLGGGTGTPNLRNLTQSPAGGAPNLNPSQLTPGETDGASMVRPLLGPDGNPLRDPSGAIRTVPDGSKIQTDGSILGPDGQPLVDSAGNPEVAPHGATLGEPELSSDPGLDTANADTSIPGLSTPGLSTHSTVPDDLKLPDLPSLAAQHTSIPGSHDLPLGNESGAELSHGLAAGHTPGLAASHTPGLDGFDDPSTPPGHSLFAASGADTTGTPSGSGAEAYGSSDESYGGAGGGDASGGADGAGSPGGMPMMPMRGMGGGGGGGGESGSTGTRSVGAPVSSRAITEELTPGGRAGTSGSGMPMMPMSGGAGGGKDDQKRQTSTVITEDDENAWTSRGRSEDDETAEQGETGTMSR